MGKHKISRGKFLMLLGLAVLCIPIICGAIWDKDNIETYAILSGVCAIIVFFTGVAHENFNCTYSVAIAEDSIDIVGNRTVRVSGMRFDVRWCEIRLSATVDINKKVKWALRLQAGRSMGHIHPGAQMLFKTAEGEIIELSHSYSPELGPEYTYINGQISGVIARYGLYYLKPDILDALCSKELVKIRIINEYEPVDIDVAGRDVTKFFRMSREAIEKALASDNTIYSGM